MYARRRRIMQNNFYGPGFGFIYGGNEKREINLLSDGPGPFRKSKSISPGGEFSRRAPDGKPEPAYFSPWLN